MERWCLLNMFEFSMVFQALENVAFWCNQKGDLRNSQLSIYHATSCYTSTVRIKETKSEIALVTKELMQFLADHYYNLGWKKLKLE